ncbi:recombinase family protein [Auritidibacter ignavus]|uniref:recombinase family protein n=1 Tax=Auritidibacter ignavus TaxID=678932 RepID=UPI0024469EBC|nr:recombinase family protein [Auritidibacter ignavus]WGH89970.1 recombinase family protein [Auritidibacter ignavus]
MFQHRHKLMGSIDDQLTESIGWCEPIRWHPDVIIRDSDRSASQWHKKEREGFDEAMALIEEGRHGGFATWEPARAGRDLEIYVQLRKACQRAGVLYLTHGRVYDLTHGRVYDLTHGRVYDLSRSDDSFMMGFEFLRAEADANTMRECQLRTATLNAEKGRPHGRLPYGHRRVYDERTGVLTRQEPVRGRDGARGGG